MPTDELPLHGVLATEEEWTGDGRRFDKGALRWDFSQESLPFRWAEEDMGAHQGARHVGWIDTAVREGNDIVWTGRSFDPAFNEYLLRAGRTGVSIDADDETYDVVIPPEALEEGEAPEPGVPHPALQEQLLFHDARIRAATAVDIPAFITGWVKPGNPGESDEEPISEPPGEERDPSAVVASVVPEGVTHAGVLLEARDTGRWLMLQRAISDGDENGGLWEFPGGGIEDGEDAVAAGAREFAEECGCAMPETAERLGEVLAPSGNYLLEVFSTPEEADYPLDDRDVVNPDDPDGDETEALAWWEPRHVTPCGYHIRAEVCSTDWEAVQGILSGDASNPEDTQMAVMETETEAPEAEAPEVPGALQDGVADALNAGLSPEQVHAAVETAIQEIAAGEEMPADDMDVLIASAAPVAPPDEWFEPFDLDGPTGITITADGRVYGHLSTWDSCHRNPVFQAKGQCVPPPRDPQPDFFHLGQVLTASGAAINVGNLTVGGGHADTRKGLIAALEHYDDVSTVVASVRAVEDEHGIALFGAVVPEATPAQIAAARRAPLSADWRKERGRFRLIAAHAVVTPGYPVTREQADYSLVASVSPDTFITTGRVETCSECGGEGPGLSPSLVASIAPDLYRSMEEATEEMRRSLVAAFSEFEPDMEIPVETEAEEPEPAKQAVEALLTEADDEQLNKILDAVQGILGEES